MRRPSIIVCLVLYLKRQSDVAHCLWNLNLKCNCTEYLPMLAQFLKSWYEGTLNLETSLFIYSGKSLFSTRDCSLRSNKKKAVATPRVICSRGVHELDPLILYRGSQRRRKKFSVPPPFKTTELVLLSKWNYIYGTNCPVYAPFTPLLLTILFTTLNKNFIFRFCTQKKENTQTHSRGSYEQRKNENSGGNPW